MRKKAAERGMFLFPGLQNTAAATQEMGGMFGEFKQGCLANMQVITQEKMVALA